MSEETPPLTYKGAGVDYNPLDDFKRAAQRAASLTKRSALIAIESTESRGESSFEFHIETRDSMTKLAHVEEGLGTKNVIADAMEKITGNTYYDAMAQDTVAMIVNDCITGGNLPLSVAMHLAVGDTAWFQNSKRWQALILGWQKACGMSQCLWGGGETPVLKGIVYPEASLLSGSCVAIHSIPKDSNLLQGPEPGDQIILLSSSGVHANGLTLARKIAENLPQGYMTPVSNGRSYGEELLVPTKIYVPLMRSLMETNLHISYIANITGHGWRKLMRYSKPLHYELTTIPTPQKIFDFIEKRGPVEKKEMYGTFNMGAGFALFVRGKKSKKVLDTARAHNIQAMVAGRVRASTNGKREVHIKPLGITFKEETLHIR